MADPKELAQLVRRLSREPRFRGTQSRLELLASAVSLEGVEHGTRRAIRSGCRCGSCMAKALSRHPYWLAFRVGCRCEPCVAAVPHGKGGYSNWGCRCDVCLAGQYPTANRRQLADCGTWSAYLRHLKRKEPVCDACRLAANAYKRERRRQARASS